MGHLQMVLPPVRGPGEGDVGIVAGVLFGVAGVLTVKGVSTENALMSPLELMAATDTTYSASGIKSRKVTLVLVVYTVVV